MFRFSREMNRFNGETFFTFMKKLRRVSARSGRQVVVIVDNARYHHAALHRPWREQVSDRFALNFLPPYSPELNPIERVWKLTRLLAIHNRYFPTLEQVKSGVEATFKKWTSANDTLRRLCAITQDAVYRRMFSIPPGEGDSSNRAKLGTVRGNFKYLPPYDRG